MSTIRSVDEGGVFRPLEPVDLPDRSTVEFEPRPAAERVTTPDFTDSPERSAARQAIYAILGERYDTGETDIAERHDEHQP